MKEKKALLVIDMVRDNLADPERNLVAREARPLIPRIRRLAAAFRQQGWPVFFANDSFLPEDFIFGGKMRPHALRGTAGAEVIPELAPRPEDFILPKRRFSAFFKTDLDQTLRTLGVGTVAVCGITSLVCVLATVLEALSHDFYTIMVEDASCAHKAEIHQALMDFYRHGPLEPLFTVQTVDQLLAALPS